MRKILHIDMDAFFASVEQRDFPEYRGKPLVVGGRPEQRGAVAAASYEARQYGIHSAMPARIAQQRCPALIFARPRFDVYKDVSRQIRDIFHRYTDLVEPLSLDEAYLDVTVNALEEPSALAIARRIKADIFATTRLTASAGVSVNKFLAKMASGQNKPDGLTLILPEQAEAFVAALPIEKFHGIGQVTARKMHALGIATGADLQPWAEADLVRHFGKAGRFYYRVAQGKDDRPVNPNRIRKSIGAERSFSPDLTTMAAMTEALEQVATDVIRRLQEQRRRGHTLTLKVKYASYRQITRSRTFVAAIGPESPLLPWAEEMLLAHLDRSQPVRLLGLTLSNLEPVGELTYVQLSLEI
ncbi:DNA polymerase IV [Nodosilinea sp. LEGE 07298]|uniref:DNA polymerase IV n=1 Tax=Nodosilinea sp. LEGE 07298 TaxID=2777970 RepID=UPI00187E1666|nr:DNA polymerase IV [Nodosilinea sp. LEGE 07298]MBE9111503.1 DNA polymerase IV [Nodosilinea sp. LEGE 07298]